MHVNVKVQYFPNFIGSSMDIRWGGECWVHCYTRSLICSQFVISHQFTFRPFGLDEAMVDDGFYLRLTDDSIDETN